MKSTSTTSSRFAVWARAVRAFATFLALAVPACLWAQAGHGIMWTKGVSGHKAWFSGNGDRVFVQQPNGAVTIFNYAQNQLIASIPVRAVWGIQPNHTGSGFFYLANNRVFFYDLATRTATQRWAEAEGFGSMQALAVSTTDSLAAYTFIRSHDQRVGIAIVNLNTGALVRRIILNTGITTHQLAFVNNNTQLLAGGLRLYNLDGTLAAARTNPLTDFFTVNPSRTRAYAVDNSNTQTVCLDLTNNLAVIWQRGVVGLWHDMQVSADDTVLIAQDAGTTSYFLRCWSTATGSKLDMSIPIDSPVGISIFNTHPITNEVMVRTSRDLESSWTQTIQKWAFNTTTGHSNRLNNLGEGEAFDLGILGTPQANLFAASPQTGHFNIRHVGDGSYTGRDFGASPGPEPSTSVFSPNMQFYIRIGYRTGTTQWGVHIHRVDNNALVASNGFPDARWELGYFGWGNDGRLFAYSQVDGRLRILSFDGSSLTRLRDIVGVPQAHLQMTANGERVVSIQNASAPAKVYNAVNGRFVGDIIQSPADSLSHMRTWVVGNRLAIHEWINAGGQSRNQVRVIDLMNDTLPVTGTPGYPAPLAIDRGKAAITPDASMAMFVYVNDDVVTGHVDQSSLVMVRASDDAILRRITDLPIQSIGHYPALQVSADGKTILATTSQGVFFAMRVPPVLVTLSVNPTSVIGGNSSVGTVQLNHEAGSGGVVVNLSAQPGLSVPATVTVPAGSSSAMFNVGTSGVNETVVRTITGTLDGINAQAQLTVNPVSDFTLALNPSSVNGGSNSTGTVTLNGQAGPGGRVIQLASNKLFATVPASVNVAAGQNSANFTVATQDPGANDVATITGQMVPGGPTRSAQLEVLSPFVITTSLVPNPAKGGNAVEYRVTMTPAPPTARTFNLAGNAHMEVPATLTFPAGATSVVIGVKTKPVSSMSTGEVTLSNAFGMTKQATVTIEPPILDRIVPTLHTVVGQTTIPMVVMLDGPAPSGLSFSMSSSNTNWATVPASVTIPEGAIFAVVDISARKLATRREVTITVGTKTTKIIILPAP